MDNTDISTFYQFINLLPLFPRLSVTANLWDVSVEAIERIMYEPRKKTYTEHHKLLQILTALREFYYCGGSGVSRRILDNERYMVWHK